MLKRFPLPSHRWFPSGVAAAMINPSPGPRRLPLGRPSPRSDIRSLRESQQRMVPGLVYWERRIPEHQEVYHCHSEEENVPWQIEKHAQCQASVVPVSRCYLGYELVWVERSEWERPLWFKCQNTCSLQVKSKNHVIYEVVIGKMCVFVRVWTLSGSQTPPTVKCNKAD